MEWLYRTAQQFLKLYTFFSYAIKIFGIPHNEDPTLNTRDIRDT